MLLLKIHFAAEDVLAQLTDQLTRRKAQLQDTGDKLAQIQQAIDDQVNKPFGKVFVMSNYL